MDEGVIGWRESFGPGSVAVAGKVAGLPIYKYFRKNGLGVEPDFDFIKIMLLRFSKLLKNFSSSKR